MAGNEPSHQDLAEIMSSLAADLDAALAPMGWACRLAVPRIDGTAYFELRGTDGRDARLDWLPPGRLVLSPTDSDRSSATIEEVATRALRARLSAGDLGFLDWSSAREVPRRATEQLLGRQGLGWCGYRLGELVLIHEASVRVGLRGPGGALALTLRHPDEGSESSAQCLLEHPGFRLYLVEDQRPAELRRLLRHQPERAVGFLLSRALHGARALRIRTVAPKWSDGVFYLFLNKSVCDLSCVFCSRGSQARKAEILRESAGFDYQAELESLRETWRTFSPKRRLEIGGHEPTLHPTLLEILRAGREAGFGEIALDTHGLSLAEPGKLEILQEAGATGVRMPIYGTRAETHDAITGVPGSHARALRAIHHMRAAGFSLALRTVVLRQNLEELVPLLDEHGNVGMSFVMPRSADPADYARCCPRLERLPERVLSGISLYLPCCFPPRPRTEVLKLLRRNRDSGFLADAARIRRQSRGEEGQSLEQRLHQLSKPTRCRACADARLCTGIYPMYFEVHGEDELRPRTSRTRRADRG